MDKEHSVIGRKFFLTSFVMSTDEDDGSDNTEKLEKMNSEINDILTTSFGGIKRLRIETQYTDYSGTVNQAEYINGKDILDWLDDFIQRNDCKNGVAIWQEEERIIFGVFGSLYGDTTDKCDTALAKFPVGITWKNDYRMIIGDNDIDMSYICSCSCKLSECDNCGKYYSCNNVAIAEDILKEYENDCEKD